MKTYHVESAQHPVSDLDILVPLDELNDPNGRYINCPECAEELAQAAGGSTKRPQPSWDGGD